MRIDTPTGARERSRRMSRSTGATVPQVIAAHPVRDQLERLADGPGGAEAARAIGAGRRLGLVVGDEPALTLRTTETGIVIDDDISEARVVVALDETAFADLAAERHSVFGLLYAGRLRVERGSVGGFGKWEPGLQALFYGRPVYDAAVAATFDGLDVGRSFTLADDPAELAEFLDRFGYLHVRGVLTAAEIEAVSDEVDCLRAEADPSDGHSWWATRADGTEVCCRLTYLAQRSETIAELGRHERLLGLAALPGLDLQLLPDRGDGLAVVIKHPTVTSGLSDLPWHRDCGLGGHPLLCPGLNIGVQLDRADAANGQLWFLPGSHRHGGPSDDPWTSRFPIVAIDTEPGDVTVHYGHVLHVAPPPSAPDAGRRALYLSFARPELFEVIPAGAAYNDVVYSGGDGRIRNIAEPTTA